MRSWARAAIFPTAVVALLAALWAGFAPASGAPGVVAQDGPWAGEWEDTSNTWQGKPNEFQLKQSGSSVSGTYDFCNGRISGTVSGNVLRGTWNQDAPPCGGASEGSGIFEYTLAGDGKSFTGRWQYKSKCSDPATCTEWRSPWNGRKISGPSPGDTPAGGDTASVVAIRGSVVFRVNGGPWKPLTRATKLGKGAEVSTEVDAEVVLKFSDGSQMTLDEMTGVLINDLLVSGSRQTVAVQLKMGELSAKVNPKKAFQTTFEMETGNLTEGARGTAFSVFYDPGSKTTLTSVTEGVVEVNPKGAGLKTVNVGAGKEVEVGAKSMTRIVGIGKAGVRKGNNRSEALDRVGAVIAKGDDPCGSTPPRKPVFGIKPDPKGWAVSVKLVGERKGTSKWRVARKEVTPLNRLARQVKKRCR